MGNKEERKKKKGREEMKGEADRTGLLNAFFVMVFTTVNFD